MQVNEYSLVFYCTWPVAYYRSVWMVELTVSNRQFRQRAFVSRATKVPFVTGIELLCRTPCSTTVSKGDSRPAAWLIKPHFCCELCTSIDVQSVYAGCNLMSREPDMPLM
jgi:hypothetical protein